MKDKKDRSFHDLEAVLSSPSGRRLAWRMIAPCEMDPTKPDTNMTYYGLGVQATARALQHEIVTQHYNWYALMLAERYADDEDKPCIAKDSE